MRPSLMPQLERHDDGENFDDGVADAFTPASGHWSVVDGAYRCYKKGAATWGLSFAGNQGWSDYVFSGRMATGGGVNHVLRVRCQGDDGYEVTVRSDDWYDAYLYKWTDGVRHQLGWAYHSGFPTGTWCDFEFTLSGNQLVFVWNGYTLFQWIDDDEPILSGGIALAAVPGGVTGWQEAFFDDIVVEALTTATEASSWSAVKALY